jgi:SAM-dependent methyltransferase
MTSWIVEVRIIFLKLVRRIFNKRKSLAFRYLRGTGIEIGAMAWPLAVRPDVKVNYLDKVDLDEMVRAFPALESRLVKPDIIDDGFTLSKIPDDSQDFVIANHVLEHTPDPIQALNQWSHILRPGGMLYFSVPIASRCFDAGRPITTVEHFLEDYQLYQNHATIELDRRNREHLAERIRISEQNMLSRRDAGSVRPAPEEVEKRVKEADIFKTNELHFHTFSLATLRELLKIYTRSINQNCEIKTIESNYTEIITILAKESILPDGSSVE